MMMMMMMMMLCRPICEAEKAILCFADEFYLFI